MRRRRLAANIAGIAIIVCICFLSARSRAESKAEPEKTLDLQLEVFINGTSRHLIASFRRNADGTFSISPDQLRNIGLLPVKSALTPEGMVVLENLPGVTYRYDSVHQTIYIAAPDGARVTEVINARRKDTADLNPVSGTGALVNYTLFGNWQNDKLLGWPIYQGVSGNFDSRVFSAYGTVTNSFIGRLGSIENVPAYTRLDSKWTYSNPDSLTTYVAGDLISRGPGWSRPIRMGGVQVRSNFALRPDLITMPIPSLSGSAAVPSTVDVLVNNSQVLSREVTGGPFQINSLPIVAGPGTTRLIVRDALGRETVTDSPYYASAELLAPGLLDYSFEAGYARNMYGIESAAYDSRLLFSGSGRRGLSDTFTVEGHTEGGAGLVNGGIGGVLALGTIGIGSLSIAGSNYKGATGFLATASVEMRLRNWTFYVRSQRSFSNYADLAAISSLGLRGSIGSLQSQALVPKALDQVSLSIPIAFDRSSLNFTLTHLKTALNETSRIAGVSYNRQIFAGGSFFVTGYRDFDRRGYGIFGGITMPIGERISTSVGVQSSNAGSVYSAEAVRPLSSAVDDYGWRVRLAEGNAARSAVAASYRLPFAKVEVGAQGGASQSQVSAQADGAVVFMDKDVFFTNRIDDAFAIIDAGVPDMEVSHQNRRVGTTNKSGKILIPTLQSWEANEISINPAKLPLDVDLGAVRQKVVPVAQSGVTVKFAAKLARGSAIVVLKDRKGKYLEVGSVVKRQGTEGNFIVGYDGEAFLDDLDALNTIAVELRDGATCGATFPFQPRPGELVRIDNVECR